MGRARLALAGGDAAVAVEECERAVALLENREFPWARARLWAFLAEAAHAAGDAGTAEQARARARQVLVTSG